MNLLYAFLLMWMWKTVSVAQDINNSGLKFSDEPPNRVDFINTKGIQVECVATGSPKPMTNWTLIDGSPVTTISGLREVSSSSGNLVFHSFRPENFRPDVHAAVYRCIATSSVGTIYSRDVNVRGVVLQNHDVQVFDSYSIEGNSAVLKCHIPTVLSEFLKVIAWIKNDNLLIQPSIEESAHDKYLLMPTGELHIRNVSLGESSSRYKCKMVNRLTGDTQISSTAGQLFVTDSRGNVSPRISDSASSVSFVVGQTAVLACVAQGNPIPTLKWFKRSFGSQRLPIDNNGRYIHTRSSLFIKDVHTEDAGAYVCEVSNDVGREQFDVVLSITEPISVSLSPSVQIVNANDRVVFHCEVTSQPLASVSWLHNGMPIFKTTGKELTIDSVQMSDRGMYQCMAKNNQDMVQAASELRLSEIFPQLEEVFEEATIKPGGRVNVKCAASGIPLPVISWNIDGIILKNDQHIRITSSTDSSGRVISILELEDAVVENGGLYSCLAVNDGGKKIYSKRINIFGPLGSRIIPERLLVSRESALLSCPLYGYPLPTISWEKDGVKLPVDYRQTLMKNGSLFIEDVDRKTNSGSYKCFASNKPGNNVEAKIDVVVMVPPKIVPFEFQDELLREGMRARLQCVVSEGDLPLTVTWLKDGRPLSPNLGVMVRVLDEFSSILTISSIAPGHNGKYVCVASNRAATVTHSAELSVNVPPKIVPFSFQDDQLVEGQLARVSCVISRGDLPLKLFWEKDGKGISTGELGIQIRSFDKHSSILSIVSVSPEHNGQYTCIASNGAGSARHSAELTVHVPPRWVVEPRSASVYKGEEIQLHCQAGGFPKPTLSWAYISEIEQFSIRKDLHTDGNINVFSNGSLFIKNMSPSNEGFYYCKATNGIGRDIISRVEVKILAPPVFINMESTVNSTVGNSAKLLCPVQGDFPIKVHWLKEIDMILDSQTKYKIQTTNSSSEILSILTITKVSREDNGNFVCVAENSHGKNQSTINVIVIEKPDPPSEFKASAVGSQYVELIWKLQYNGNSPIKKYTIQYKESQNSWDESVTMETVNGEPKNSVVTHLHPATSYVFRIFSENNVGRSSSSQLLRVTTNEDVPSGPPLNVQVESVNTETIKVLWKAPEEKLWNGKILGFYVGYKEVDTEDPYLYKTLLTPVPNADDLAIQIGGLKQFTKYAVIVQAYNGQGKGPKSEPVIIMTSEGAPSLPPTDVRCTTLTSQSIHVTWTAPPTDSINGILRGYKVLYKPASDWFEDMAENYNFTFPTSLTMNHLEKFSNYSIQVLAMTKTAEGPRSTAIFCKTLDDVPGSPVDIKAIAMTDDSVIVAWKPPDHPNGVIRLYSVYWKAEGNAKDAGTHTVPVRENSYEVTGLKKGRRYDFYVTASTMAGEGLPSRMVTQHPSGPTVAAKIVSFEDKIMTPWQSSIEIPCRAVGIPEPLRKWTFKGRIMDSNEKSKILSDGTLTIHNVLEEDAGDYVCHVQNDYGEDTITYTILVLAPPSAPIINVASVTSNSIEINWKTPSSKMSRIKGYNLHVQRDSSESIKEVTLGADVRSYKLNNLECGMRHEIHMTAFNKIGVGASSELLVVSTNGSVPISPSNSDLIEESSTSISLYLNTWKNNGCPVRYFVVEYAPKSSNEWTVVSDTVKPEQRRLIIPNLKPGTWYGLRMTAHNSAGLSVAQYDFATLTSSGATISPDLQNDSTGVQLDSLWSYLNIYIIIPVAVTVVILFAILAVACMCLSRSQNKKRHSKSKGKKNKRLSAISTEMKRGDSSESFAYMQRGNVHRSDRKSKHDEIAPYATLNLANQRTTNHGSMAGRSVPPVPPPLPPPRMEFSHSNRDSHGFNQQPFFSPGQSNFVHGQGGATETTFIFPNINNPGLHFPPQYPHEAMKAACFKH